MSRFFPEHPNGDYTDNSHVAKFVLLSGVSGTGKSTLGAKLARETLRQSRFNFFFDPENQWAEWLGGYVCTSLREAAAAISTGVCFYSPDDCGDTIEGYRKFSEWFWNFGTQFRGVKTLWADEINGYLPHHPDNYVKHPQHRIMDRGRKRGMRFVGISPALQELAPNFRKQFTEIYAFQNPDETCVKFLASRGLPAEQVMRLNVGEFLHLDARQRIVKAGKVRLKS